MWPNTKISKRLNIRYHLQTPAYGVKPQLHQYPQRQQHPQQEEQEKETDVVEVTITEFRCSQGYFIHIEEPKEAIEPMFLIGIKNMKSSAHNSALMTCPKQEHGQSSRARLFVSNPKVL
ncbi:hypothetical protein N665_0091s0026 [Sinapis alba]|nr:hypothetical protein N665_0091s0026 [Sinapis alba]